MCIRHIYQEAVGGRMWLLFQSGFSLANGFPEPDEELENATLIEVQVLSQQSLSRNKDVSRFPQYDA